MSVHDIDPGSERDVRVVVLVVAQTGGQHLVSQFVRRQLSRHPVRRDQRQVVKPEVRTENTKSVKTSRTLQSATVLSIFGGFFSSSSFLLEFDNRSQVFGKLQADNTNQNVRDSKKEMPVSDAPTTTILALMVT